MGSTVTSARVAGALLVERGLVTTPQLAEALEHQRAHGGELDEILATLFDLSRAELSAVMCDRDAANRVDIGSILLATGAVDEVRLAEARERSAGTGQPVGPILVEMGAISRLDLASALADQWSDSPAQILPPPGVGERQHAHRMPGESVDDLRFAMAALEASVRAANAVGDESGALEEVLRRENALTERIASLKHAIDQPVDADPGLVAEIRGIAEGLETLQTTLVGVASTDDVAALGSALAEIGDLRAGLASLEERLGSTAPLAVVEEIRAEAAALAERVTGIETVGDELVPLASAIDALAARPAGDPEVGGRVDELARAVEVLAARPVGDPEVGRRLDELARAVEALGVLADASTGAEGLQEAVAGLSSRIDDAVAAVAGLDDLPARAVELGTEVETLRAQLGEVSSRAEVDTLRAQLEEVSSRAEVAPDLEQRVDRLAELHPLVADATSELAALRAELDALAARPDSGAGLTERLDGLGERLEELARRPASDPGLAERVDGLTERLDGLAERVEALSVEALGPAAEAAVAGVAERVQSLADAQEQNAGHTEALREGVESLRAGVEALHTRLEDLRASLGELHEQIPAAQRYDVIGERLDALEALLDHLVERIDGAAPVSALTSLMAAVEQLAGRAEERFEGVLARMDHVETTSGRAAGADDEFRGEIAGLGAAVETVRATVSAEVARVEAAWLTERAALEELLASRLGTTDSPGQSAAADGGPVTPSSPEIARLTRELERVSDRVMEQERSLVEHFARRERALIERLGGGNDVGQKLTELTRGMDELRTRIDRVGASGGTGVDGALAEELAAVKDSLFTRLERLASSIDWRFQRLEGGPAAAAGRSDLRARADQLARVGEPPADAEGPPGRVDGASGADRVGEQSPDMFLVLVPTATGHQLVELSGGVPEAGSTISTPLGTGELLVVAVGSSPLPDDDRACVFVESADAPAPA